MRPMSMATSPSNGFPYCLWSLPETGCCLQISWPAPFLPDLDACCQWMYASWMGPAMISCYLEQWEGSPVWFLVHRN